MTDRPSGLNARDDLLWIADQWTRLRARLRPGGGNALNGMPRGGASGVPIDVHVSDLLHEITENVARFYGRILLEEVNPIHGCKGVCHGSLDHRHDDDSCSGLSIPPDRCPERVDPITTSAMPGLLVQVANRYGHFTEGDDVAMELGFCDDAHDYRMRVRKALERPAPPTYVGPCQHKGEDGAGCEGELYVKEGHDRGVCKECGSEFTVLQQRDWLEQELSDRLMTASEIVSALVVLDTPVPSGTVKAWISRKRLVEAVPESGLYRLAEAKELAARRRAA